VVQGKGHSNGKYESTTCQKDGEGGLFVRGKVCGGREGLLGGYGGTAHYRTMVESAKIYVSRARGLTLQGSHEKTKGGGDLGTGGIETTSNKGGCG